MASLGNRPQSGTILRRQARAAPARSSPTLLSRIRHHGVSPVAPSRLMAALPLLLIAGGPAMADCDSLREGIVFLAIDLADMAEKEAESAAAVGALVSEIAAADDAARSALRARKDDAERNLEILREQLDQIVGKVAEKGKRLKDECPSDGQ